MRMRRRCHDSRVANHPATNVRRRRRDSQPRRAARCPVALFSSAPDFVDDSGALSVWMTSPLGIFTEFREGAHFSEAMARFLTTRVEAALEARRSTTKAAVYVHDWSKLKSYDSAARQLVMMWPLQIGRDRIDEMILIVATTTPSFVKMAYEVGTAATRVAGFRISISKDLAADVRRLGLRHAP